jgi:hypothetical protein
MQLRLNILCSSAVTSPQTIDAGSLIHLAVIAYDRCAVSIQQLEYHVYTLIYFITGR